MKDFFIADAAQFENARVVSYFALASLQKREKRGGGGQYLALILADKTGQMEGRMWEEFAEAVSTCNEGCYVKVQGQISKYQGKFQITLEKLRSAAETEVEAADFLPATKFDVEAMWAELRGFVDAFTNEDLKRLVFAFLNDEEVAAAYKTARRRSGCTMPGWADCSSMWWRWRGCAGRRRPSTRRWIRTCW